jgi:hypothetical protein
MGKLTTEQYVLTETERAIMEAVWEGANGERPHRMYTSWVADAIHRSESTAARLANGLARKGLLERQQEKHAEYVYWETTTAGTPFPDPLERPGPGHSAVRARDRGQRVARSVPLVRAVRELR